MSERAELLFDSSPLKPDSVAGSPTAEPGSPVCPDDPTTSSPTCTVSHSTQNRHPAEDMTQFATEVSHVHKLIKVNHEQLQTFSKVNITLSPALHNLDIAQYPRQSSSYF